MRNQLICITESLDESVSPQELSEMDQTKSGLFLKLFLKGRGAEIVIKIRPSPIL
jgi:hypothetical protein